MKDALADKELRCNLRIQEIYMLNNIPGMIFMMPYVLHPY